MEFNIDNYYINQYICSICGNNGLNIIKCQSCKLLSICLNCTYNKQIYYYLNIINFETWVYIHICINCIVDKFFKTNIYDYNIKRLYNILKLNEVYNCDHKDNLYNIFLNIINNISIYEIIDKKDETLNSSYDKNNIFKYNNNIIFDKKCFICMVNFIKNNYRRYKYIFENIILKLNLKFNLDSVIIPMPTNILNYMQNSSIINLINKNNCTIKIIAKLLNKRYDDNYDFKKNSFNKSITKVYKKFIYRYYLSNNKVTYNRKHKYYLYCDFKTEFQSNIINNLKNTTTYSVNEYIFNKIHTINNYNNILYLINNLLKTHKYKYIITLDIQDAYNSIKFNYLIKVLYKYIKNEDLTNDIIIHLNNLKNVFKQSNSDKLYLNIVSNYLFKLCMYDVIINTINNTISKNLEFYNVCDDFIFFDNNIYDLITNMNIFVSHLNKNYLKLNINKFRLYEIGKQNIYFLNNVIYPSDSLKKIIDTWRHITYKPESKIYKNLLSRYKYIFNDNKVY
ncbi:unknown similar to AMEV260 [Choristoneura rosaceana entomopoxvirus 'L']|uniref:Reverse transcriptase domain-containing protein n=1 Tax=Choristoneura rosaceana entomopoxvirus 'L' TaxID=1293539 RepID=A0ABM9QKX2_9POXV|nr:unknown similar to AMEV260 [Choristoneura rosaceana entomopoxvirus 'L']CCU56166.1 unknown similar to AMEV260 [Choristoneura rosaceana entomopoxvirus 'L']